MQNQGLVVRSGGEKVWLSLPVAEMRLLETVLLAERLGYHSAWFCDHIFTTRDDLDAKGPLSMRRVRPERCVMLETVTAMALAAGATTRIKVAAGVLVLPYRHPLVTAQQLATIDAVSNGRTLVAVGAGWLRSEFTSLGVSYEDRGARTEEALQVLDLVWTQPWATFEGRFYSFRDVAIEPKPVQRPRIPLLGGGFSPAAARRAARHCDGFFPRLNDDVDDAPSSADPLIDELRREADRIGRDLASFTIAGLGSARIHDRPLPAPRPFLNGSADQLLDDLERLARHGYSHCTLRFDIDSPDVGEFLEQVDHFGRDVIEPAMAIEAAPI